MNVRSARSSLTALLLALSACGGLPVSRAALVHNARGAAHLAAGDLDAAEARFRLALEHRPGFAEARANLALVTAERGHLEDAERHARGALASNADFALGWSTLGLVLERKGDDDGAEASYAHALSIDPDLPTPRRNLALLLLRGERHAEARAHLLRLRAIDPNDLDARAHLAWCELRLGRPRAAFDEASEVLNVRAGHPRALMVRGAARARLGEARQAADDLRRASRDRRLRSAALSRLLLVAMITGENAEAARVAAILRRDFRRDPAAAYALEAWSANGE